MMARFYEPRVGQIRSWDIRLTKLPDDIRAVAECFDPWSLYKMKSTGYRVIIHHFEKDRDGSITATVDIRGAYNLVSVERRVYGVVVDDLEECELPSTGERVGIVSDHELEILAVESKLDDTSPKALAERELTHPIVWAEENDIDGGNLARSLRYILRLLQQGWRS